MISNGIGDSLYILSGISKWTRDDICSMIPRDKIIANNFLYVFVFHTCNLCIFTFWDRIVLVRIVC